MWNKNKISIVLLTKNNVGTIRYVIEDLFLTGYIDDMIVIDLHSTDDTINEVSYTKSRLLSSDSIKEALSLGIERARGDLVIFWDPEGTYRAQEITKLLPYSNDFDVVFASRTQNIGYRTELKHYSYSKIFKDLGESLSKKYLTPIISDIDSNIFMIRRSNYLNKRFFLEYDEEFYILEFMLRTIKNNTKFTQIPLEWSGEFGSKRDLTNFITKSKFIIDVKKIIEDKQKKSILKSKIISNKMIKDEPVIREFQPERIYEPVKISKSVKKKSVVKKTNTKNKTKTNSKKKTQSKKNTSIKSVLAKAQNTTNRFEPDEFN